MSHKLRAVLDIGSNTIRLLIADVSASPFQRIHYQHHIARLGEGLQRTGQLGEAGQQRALAVFTEVVEVCHGYGIAAANIKAVATAAMREASNGSAFGELVQTQTQLSIAIISGEQEAKLALCGALSALNSEIGQDMLLFDIGGGSTEFTRVRHGNIVDSVSEKLGVVRLTESYVRSDPPKADEYAAMKHEAEQFLSNVEVFWAKNKHMPHCLVGTAGTVTTLAAIAQGMQSYDAAAINNYQLCKADFLKLRDDLLSKNNAEKLLLPSLEQGREDVIIAGLAIVEVLFARWGFDALVAVDSGLLEGLLDQDV